MIGGAGFVLKASPRGDIAIVLPYGGIRMLVQRNGAADFLQGVIEFSSLEIGLGQRIYNVGLVGGQIVGPHKKRQGAAARMLRLPRG